MNHNENTPTDDEREALERVLTSNFFYAYEDPSVRELADAILAARFRRPEAPEPSAARECGFMGCGSPRCVEVCTPEQGDPSDAQRYIDIALSVIAREGGDIRVKRGLEHARAALRAAGGAR